MSGGTESSDQYVPSDDGVISAIAQTVIPKNKENRLLNTKKVMISKVFDTVPSDLPTQYPNKGDKRSDSQPPRSKKKRKIKSAAQRSLVHTSPKGSVAESFRVLPFNKMAVNKGKPLTVPP